MKKAGIDLPLRQFQGTLDLLKCLSPSLVTPLAAAFLFFFLTETQNPVSAQSGWLAVGI